ncbi:MAG: DUF924 family protein [Alphaproteobacteria bacterium]
MSLERSILDDVHEFWFGKLTGPDAKAAAGRTETWFNQSDEMDRKIRDEFGAAVGEAAETDWELGALTRERQVGLVVLLDQFPRNIHRTSGEAFSHDRRVRGIANELLAFGISGYYAVERPFILLPLMHSEAIADQDRCVMLMAEQAIAASEDWSEEFRNGLDFATKHRDLIRRFGRFPHRNEMIGRQTTDEEAAFLAEHGRGF